MIQEYEDYLERIRAARERGEEIPDVGEPWWRAAAPAAPAAKATKPKPGYLLWNASDDGVLPRDGRTLSLYWHL